MRYAHLRQRSPQRQRRLMLSICTYGLLDPIRVIAAAETVGAASSWTVIDGYCRINAMRRLGKETIAAKSSGLSADEALLTLYRAHQSRPWEPLEEATLLQDLMTQHQYSQVQLAQRFGKSETWVSHRLQLITELPEFVAKAVYQGMLSHWSASRVLIPFARANSLMQNNLWITLPHIDIPAGKYRLFTNIICNLAVKCARDDRAACTIFLR